MFWSYRIHLDVMHPSLEPTQASCPAQGGVKFDFYSSDASHSADRTECFDDARFSFLSLR
jgi:hypothetical protein